MHTTLINHFRIPTNHKPRIYNAKNHEPIELDLIGWKILLTKGMAQFKGSLDGETIPTDIIHILNPSTLDSGSTAADRDGFSNSPDSHSKPQRRRHSYNHEHSSRARPQHQKPRHHHHALQQDSEASSLQRARSYSVTQVDSQPNNTNNTSIIERPQVWIRVPESDLTTVWTALSGFYTSLDTGNYGVIDAGIRVVRASRYLVYPTGILRSKW